MITRQGLCTPTLHLRLLSSESDASNTDGEGGGTAEVGPVCWFSDVGLGVTDGQRKKRRVCEACHKSVPEDRLALHGLPHANTHAKLDSGSLDRLLFVDIAICVAVPLTIWSQLFDN